MQPLIALPLSALLILRAFSTNSLTYPGILVAACTALLHAAHPSAVPFTLLCAFFLAGTTATKIKHDVKSRLTLSSTGGEGARTHIQVLANSGVASVLVLLQLWRAGAGGGRGIKFWVGGGGGEAQGGREARDHYDYDCVPTTGSTSGLILAGIVANYAAVAADTLSSELGILARSEPRLITRPWVRVPRGTNGGITIAGILAGVFGALVVGVVSVAVMPFCGGGKGLGPVSRVLMEGERLDVYRGWNIIDKSIWVLAVTVWGASGSLLDSLLGALLQASVVDRRTGKIVEGAGGVKVLVDGGKGVDSKRSILHAESHKDEAFTARRKGERDRDERTTTSGQQAQEQEQKSSRTLLVGMDWLDNNEVNLLMAASMTFGGMLVAAWFWEMPSSSIWR
jgi:uncharacterized membrane protein